MQAALKDQRPSDGYFVEFWRLLVECPEIVAWDRLFDEGKHQVLAEVKAAVKSVRASLQVGFHIEHVNSFNPIFRATRRYDDLAKKADFLKVVVYNNCGGGTLRELHSQRRLDGFRDVPRDELLQFNNHLLNYGSEAKLDQLPTAGLSPDYVFRETQRALAGVGGQCKVFPGIDIGIPTGKNSRQARRGHLCCGDCCSEGRRRWVNIVSQILGNGIGKSGERRTGGSGHSESGGVPEEMSSSCHTASRRDFPQNRRCCGGSSRPGASLNR